MTQSRAISRYAEAFFMYAQSESFLDKAYQDSKLILDSCHENRDFKVFLSNPVIRGDKKANVIRKAFEGNISKKTLDFIQLIIDNRRETFLPEMLKRFNKLYLEHNNIVDAEIVTAAPLKEEVMQKLKAFVAKLSGYKHVELNNVVKEEIIGGFALKYNDKRLDASVSHQLSRIRKEISNY